MPTNDYGVNYERFKNIMISTYLTLDVIQFLQSRNLSTKVGSKCRYILVINKKTRTSN